MLFLYRYLSTLSRFVPLAPWEYHLSGGAVCTTESLSGPKLLSSASSARKPVAKCGHPSKTHPASQANSQTQAPLESNCTTTKICGRFEGLASESSPADLHNKNGVLADAVYLQGEQHAIV